MTIPFQNLQWCQENCNRLSTFVQCSIGVAGVQYLKTLRQQFIYFKPCGSWVTNKGVVVKHGVENITSLVDAGFLPLLHGDCVLDQTMGCKILSGDTIIKVCILGVQG